MIRNFFKKLYLVFIFILLYAPIGTLIVLSFNASKTRAKWGGFSLKWYVSLFDNEQILQALYNTLLIALLSALIATVIGTMASIALHSMKSRTRTFWMSMANIPMLNAEIVTGISLMLLFIAAGNFLSMFGASLTFGFGTILIGHITFNLPYVILSVMPKLRQVNILLMKQRWISAPHRFTLFSKWYCRISCPACSPAFCWHLHCHWMILSSLTL